jgi:ribonuclease HI
LNCITNNLAATEWIRGWKRNNWIKKSDSKPVMNKDLMVKIDELQEKLQLKWVKLFLVLIKIKHKKVHISI